ncbi:MAG: hypothetical protein LCH62_12510 [Proteobacteria bacterium]|nr:hypothetical protein [Pseudomonadota bacterium]
MGKSGSTKRAAGDGTPLALPPPVVVMPDAKLPGGHAWRPLHPAQNFLGFVAARSFPATLAGPGAATIRIRIKHCVAYGARSFHLKPDGKGPRYAVVLEPKRGADLPPEGLYDLVSECGYIGRLADVRLRHVPNDLRTSIGGPLYFNVL